MRPTVPRLLLCVAVVCVLHAGASSEPRRPLDEADITAITQLVMLEDARRFDEEILARLIKASHPEVRRRAVVHRPHRGSARPGAARVSTR
jgi:hypothetical protein